MEGFSKDFTCPKCGDRHSGPFVVGFTYDLDGFSLIGIAGSMEKDGMEGMLAFTRRADIDSLPLPVREALKLFINKLDDWCEEKYEKILEDINNEIPPIMEIFDEANDDKGSAHVQRPENN